MSTRPGMFLLTHVYAPEQQEQKLKLWNNRICESLHIYTHTHTPNQCIYLHHLEAALTLEEEEYRCDFFLSTEHMLYLLETIVKQ